MPLYEYYCEHCDQVFSSLKSIQHYNSPETCQGCGNPANRILYTAPRLNTMRPEIRKAHQVNEKSAHEPRMSHGHRCGPSCHHHKHQHSETNKPEVKQQRGKRPWMLGH